MKHEMEPKEVRRRLAQIKSVVTLKLGVVNEVVRVEKDQVIMRSSRTGTERPIRFSSILGGNWNGNSGRIKQTLARILGHPGA